MTARKTVIIGWLQVPPKAVWIAIDGTKFRTVASIDSTRERVALQRYLEQHR
jgi:hypothetical protein